MSEPTKQARLDNWPMFVMSRLQVFFNKTDFCDLTLQFDGNVQLKVHRLIMNACTEYFQLLEQECDMHGDVLIMPPDLQVDVILPIVNFMYTGILEYQHSIFEKLYKTAELMNFKVLLRFLDAQRNKSKLLQQHLSTSSPAAGTVPASRRAIKAEKASPVAPLSGRKLPVWKRKPVPLPVQINPVKPYSPEPRTFISSVSAGITGITVHQHHQSPASGASSRFDNTPKPTRFEWPDEDIKDIKPFDAMPIDNSFETISYTTKPLLTQEEEMSRTSSSSVFDDLRTLPANKAVGKKEKDYNPNNTSVDMEDLKSYVKEQKIRSGLADYDDDPDDPDYVPPAGSGISTKRRLISSPLTSKRARTAQESKEKHENLIEIRASAKIDHSKIISEVMKKYPHLMQKSKNIRLKILTKNTNIEQEADKKSLQLLQPPIKKPTGPDSATGTCTVSIVEEHEKSGPTSSPPPAGTVKHHRTGETTWCCTICSSNGEPVEFVLYYLYRKHMTDMHQQTFDWRNCKHCGARYESPLHMTHHMYLSHGIAPPRETDFQKCKLCSYIALDKGHLNRHLAWHAAHSRHTQCPNCMLGFDHSATLKVHMRLAGHAHAKSTPNFECQYCTRHLNSACSLFVHIRSTHLEDARKDGMLGLDDPDTTDTETPAAPARTLVKVLSNEQVTTQSTMAAATAASAPAGAEEEVQNDAEDQLRPFDIVVLEDQQQYILQNEPEAQSASLQDGQQAYVTLPELQNQAYQSDIASTDELVMVLTDHDYNDGNNDAIINNDNSNIVVLYSHPVEGGQQNQFITRQGNLILNSETGMLEIHNDGALAAESIEMIQKEIESSGANIEAVAATPTPMPMPEEKKVAVEMVDTEGAAIAMEGLPVCTVSADTPDCGSVEEEGATQEQPMEVDVELPEKQTNDKEEPPAESSEHESQDIVAEIHPALQDEQTVTEETTSDSTITSQEVEAQPTEEECKTESKPAILEQCPEEPMEVDGAMLSSVSPTCSPPAPPGVEPPIPSPPPPLSPPVAAETNEVALTEEHTPELTLDESVPAAPAEVPVSVDEELPSKEVQDGTGIQFTEEEELETTSGVSNGADAAASTVKPKKEGISHLLNDWEDTDSQQSEQGKNATTLSAAGAAVNKLINDWDDE